jgi:hypothetical protein
MNFLFIILTLFYVELEPADIAAFYNSEKLCEFKIESYKISYSVISIAKPFNDYESYFKKKNFNCRCDAPKGTPKAHSKSWSFLNFHEPLMNGFYFSLSTKYNNKKGKPKKFENTLFFNKNNKILSVAFSGNRHLSLTKALDIHKEILTNKNISIHENTNSLISKLSANN